MDFEFFESISTETAQAFLDRFLTLEKAGVEEMKPLAMDAGLLFDFSITSLPDVLKWMIKDVHIVRIPVPETEPDWIRQAHKDGLIEFDDPSKLMVLRAAYYLGESFVKNFPKLHWAIGNPEFIKTNMPVVTGFTHDKEMAPMMVVQNIFTRIVGRGAELTHVDTMINGWLAAVP